jgi:23S rRNA pseudouridine2604 synthase
MKKIPEETSPAKPEWPMRINKYLAQKNYSTRRGADELIEKKRVIINGRIAVLGDKVSETDTVEVKSGKKPASYEYYAFNKPVGVVTLAPKRGEKCVADFIDKKGVFPVGRLDKVSEGLIILTTDGRVTDRLLNPKHDHEKEYVVTTHNSLRNNFQEKMEGGVDIGDAVTKPCAVKILGDKKFSITLSEGRHHQIRRMCSACFAEVKDLKRVRIMNISLGTLPAGRFRKLEGAELEAFLSSLGL